MASKVLMIGLDGATFTILKPMMDDGVMPVLKSLIDEGVQGDLMSTRNPLTPPAWISMVTGRSPHVHGVYDFLRPSTTEDGNVHLKVNDFRDVRSETVWSMVNRHGKRATSLNFYGMAPPQPIDGYVASGFVPWRHLRKGVHPPALFDTLRNLPGFDYKLLGMDIGEEKKAVQGLVEGEHDDWIKLQDERDRAWTDVCCHLMETDRTELTAVVLDGPDKLQHLFWRFVDPALLEESPSDWWNSIRALCLDFYRTVDNNIRRLIETAGPDTNVILTSDHGFGATTEVVYLNEWLARHGYLKWADDASTDGTGKLTADKLRDHQGAVDWKNTLAYCPTPSSNAIYIKRANGDSHGVTSADYLDFCLKLKTELLGYRDEKDGGQVFSGVDTNKLEGTPYVEPSPDVTVRLRDGGFVSILKSGDVVVPREAPDGTHRPNGIFVAWGPDIRSGETIDPLDLLDITPMMLHMLGLPVPEDLEGRVPVEAFRPEALEAQPVSTSGQTAGGATAGAGKAEPSREERDALIKQMKILGYMD